MFLYTALETVRASTLMGGSIHFNMHAHQFSVGLGTPIISEQDTICSVNLQHKPATLSFLEVSTLNSIFKNLMCLRFQILPVNAGNLRIIMYVYL